MGKTMTLFYLRITQRIAFRELAKGNRLQSTIIFSQAQRASSNNLCRSFLLNWQFDIQFLFLLPIIWMYVPRDFNRSMASHLTEIFFGLSWPCSLSGWEKTTPESTFPGLKATTSHFLCRVCPYVLCNQFEFSLHSITKSDWTIEWLKLFCLKDI